jgi:3-hydroxyisobutyrate dehydrogenase-like beta-hydroxyacid dehydrogenase
MGAQVDQKTLIGFIGLGNIGGPMARRVRAAGYPMIVHDLDPAKLARLTELGAQAAGSPRGVAEQAEIILLSLPDSSVVQQVALGPAGLIEGGRPGTLIADLTSGQPPLTRLIAEKLAERSIQYIDAAVSGGTAGAEVGTLAVMVGGDPALLERCRPVLEAFGKHIFHAGPIGAGHTIKALNNFLAATTLIATSEALTVAVQAGLDPQTAIDIINRSSGQSFASSHRFPRFIFKGDFTHAGGMATWLLEKDLATALALGREHTVPMPVAGLIQQICALAMRELGRDAANQGIARLYEKWAGVEIRSSEGSRQ